MIPPAFVSIVKDSWTCNEVMKRTKFSRLKVKRLLQKHNINTSHFVKTGKRARVRKTYVKQCIACKKEFTAQYFKQTFCSHKCSNSYIPHNPVSQYQAVCFKYHKKECVVCGENIVIDVHHLDENHKNNTPQNLVPLCPTHHRYLHCKAGKDLIYDKVIAYVEHFKNTVN